MNKYDVTINDEGESLHVICKNDRELLDLLNTVNQEDVTRIVTWKVGDIRRREIPLEWLFF